MKEVSIRLTLPPAEHRELRILVAQRGTNIRTLVREFVRRELATAKEQPAKK